MAALPPPPACKFFGSVLEAFWRSGPPIRQHTEVHPGRTATRFGQIRPQVRTAHEPTEIGKVQKVASKVSMST
jgi:hypothetical protein